MTAPENSASVCYLCGEALGDTRPSRDHRIPKQLLDRTQAKVRGYHYGGYAFTHEHCNNRFAPEIHARTSMELLRVLYDPDCSSVVEVQHRGHRVRTRVLSAQCFAQFSAAERRFFGVVDARGKDVPEAVEALVTAEVAVDSVRVARDAVLSVLAKSAAAVLLHWSQLRVPSYWKIHAFPLIADIPDEVLLQTFPLGKIFSDEVSTYADELGHGDYLVVYRAHGVVVFFVFQFSPRRDLIVAVKQRLARRNLDCVFFGGVNLMALVGHRWGAAAPL